MKFLFCHSFHLGFQAEVALVPATFSPFFLEKLSVVCFVRHVGQDIRVFFCGSPQRTNFLWMEMVKQHFSM